MIKKKIKKELVRDAQFCSYLQSSQTKLAKHHGFYLIEAILAIFLLTVGLLAVVNLLSKIMSSNIQDRDNVMAVMLAQEGTELVRNLRDNNFAQGKDAFDTSTFPGINREKCNIDKNSSDVNVCGPEIETRLQLENVGKFYVHSAGTPTKFRRRISITHLGTAPDNYIAVTSTVIWKGIFDSSLSLGNLPTNCTVSNGCTYIQVNLTKWN